MLAKLMRRSWALPSWIYFDASNNNLLKFNGTAPSIVGTNRLNLFATDIYNATSNPPATFQINVVPRTNPTIINNEGAQDNTPIIAGAAAGGAVALGLLLDDTMVPMQVFK